MLRGNRVRPVCLFVALFFAVTALLTTGCLWGRVMDSDTGAPISGATVSYVDSYGHTGMATTNSGGLYWFDSASGPVPALGPITLNVSAPGYAPFSQPTLVQYDDNPNASLANLSSFWDVQSIVLAPSGGPSTDLALTDLFLDNQPSGTLWARITNNGPDSLVGANVQLQCSADRIAVASCDGSGSGPLQVPVLYTADPGQTVSTNTGLGLDTSNYWYTVSCTITPSPGSYNDPNAGNNYMQKTIPAATGDLELIDIRLSTGNEVYLMIGNSGPTGQTIREWVDIGGSQVVFTGGNLPQGSMAIYLGEYVSGTQTVKVTIASCSAPETNPFNNQMVKTCSSASQSCW